MAVEEDIDLIARCGAFDLSFYRRQVEGEFDYRTAVADYLTRGWKQGLNPSPWFDTSYYVRNTKRARLKHGDPLTHFLRVGRPSNRRARLGRGRLVSAPDAPSFSAWKALAAKAASQRARPTEVHVVVPVYKGHDDTLACLHTVLSSANNTAYRVCVVNDCSPDGRLVAALREIESLGLIDLIHNQSNEGFVRSANEGFDLSNEADLVLLNSDTLVYGDWIDRLRSHVRGDPSIGVVSPLSSNATILSYPYRDSNNNIELEMSFEQLDELMSAVNGGRSLDIPTAHGFCMYLSRPCIRATGRFDEESFGRGYGEETDYCRRAAAAGWRIVTATDVYVRHTGEVSFGVDAKERRRLAKQRMLQKHPDYDDLLAAFATSDPLAQTRERIDLARWSRVKKGAVVLFIEHDGGGGVRRHINELAGWLSAERVSVLRAFPDRGRMALLVEPVLDLDLPNLPAIPLDDEDKATEVLQGLGVKHIHIHSLFGYSSRDVTFLQRLLARSRIGYDFTLHDYAALCPKLYMIDWGGSFCDSPGPAYCEVCVSREPLAAGEVDLTDWRESYRQVLQGARRLIAPNADVAQRIADRLPVGPSLVVRPHPEVAEAADCLRRLPTRPMDEMRVGLIGAINPHKGSRVLLALAANAIRRKLPLSFIVYGSVSEPTLREFPNVTVMGKYDETDITHLLEAEPCSFVFFPSVWPETHCYTLSIAFRHALYPVAFDFGAPAERILDLGFGETLSRELIYRPSALNDRLLAVTPAPPAADLGDRYRERYGWRSAEHYYGPLPLWSSTQEAQDGQD